MKGIVRKIAELGAREQVFHAPSTAASATTDTEIYANTCAIHRGISRNIDAEAAVRIIGKLAMMRLQEQASARVNDSIEELIDSAESRHALVLTNTFRATLAELMRSSPQPHTILRLGFAIYEQGIMNGDTSVPVGLLEHAAISMNRNETTAN